MTQPTIISDHPPADGREMYLIAEYCAGPFYSGWWLYLRDNMGRQQRNADGDWGWIQYCGSWADKDEHPCRAVFDALGIQGSLRGGCGDESAIAMFAFAHRIPRQRIGRKPRGCVPVVVGEYGVGISLSPEFTPRQKSVSHANRRTN